MTQNQKWPKIKNDQKSKMTRNQKWPEIKNDPKSKMTQKPQNPINRIWLGARLKIYIYYQV